MERVLELLRQEKWRVGMVGLGMSLLGVGGWQMSEASRGNEVVVQDISNEEKVTGFQEVVVDVGGAVENPGLYRVDSGARVGEVIEMAGGMSEYADQTWVSKMMNLAEKVEDGEKVFIPAISENSGNDQYSTTNDQSGEIAGAAVVNINTASEGELDGLWGIGEARARQIIEKRPYGSVEELVSKAGIPENVLEKNEGKMGVY